MSDQDPTISPETALPGEISTSDECRIGQASENPVKRSANEVAVLAPCHWSDWLTVDRVMLVYGIARPTVYELKAHVRWARAPMIGLVFYRPSIEAHIEAHAKGKAARELQGEMPTGPRRMRR